MFHFQFGDPYLFLLLLLLGAAGWAVYARRIKKATIFAAMQRLPAAPRTWRTVLRTVLPFFYLLGLAFVISSLARPQTVLSKSIHKSNVIAIEMVVDASGSMQALDFSPLGKYRTRLDVVKETFAKFIKKRPEDLIGLVTFGGYATSRVPLTIDHNVLLHVLKGVQIPQPMLDQDGKVTNEEEMLTAIGDALTTACARLEKADIKSKIIVLLSDGESNTGIIKPEQAMQVAKTLGIKVYTIGIGSNTRAPFLTRDLFGRKRMRYVNVRLDEELLRRIAEQTKGQYFNVKDPKGLTRALNNIDKLEKTKMEKESYRQFNELFPLFLLPGIILIALATTLNMVITKQLI